MPVTSEVGRIIGHDNHVIDPDRDVQLTAGAEIFLSRGVSLDRADSYPENIAHMTRAIADPMASTTITMSIGDRFCSRNGLKPMFER